MENLTALNVRSQEEAYELFNGLSAGNQIEMPFAENPDGTYFAIFRGKFGIE